MILSGTLQRISEVSQKWISFQLHGDYAPNLFLTEAASKCTEQVEPGRKSDTRKAFKKSGEFSQ